jgi:acyl dehydratase
LEDLYIGQSFNSGTYQVDEDAIKAFASAFDPQPFHLDAEAAKRSLFGGLAASGMHTAAITMRLLVESGLPLAGGLVGMGAELAWPRPTRPGDILRVTSKIRDINPFPSRRDCGFVTFFSETRNQHRGIVQFLTGKLVVLRRGEALVRG